MHTRFTRTANGLTRTHTIKAGINNSTPKGRVAARTDRINSAINMGTGLGSGQMQAAQHAGTHTYMSMMQGLAPENNPSQMSALYRDCYYNDSIAGSTVDMSAMFPFSEYTLTGLPTAEIEVYEDSLSRINMRPLMSEIGATYLTDGAFIGTLVLDSQAKSFQDILVHDTASASISLQPMQAMDPSIQVNTAGSLQSFFNTNNPYIEQMMSGYPKQMLEAFTNGPTFLDPLSTLYIPRRGMQDRAYNSYLHRLIPIFLLEKVLYRGTLLELSRRQRSTTHIKMGDENWIPTDEELQTGLAEFQMTEFDPLGAWIATRQGVDINEIRSPSEFFKWTDIAETLVPLKLRALSISEAFLSGDACLAGNTLIPTDKGLVRIDSFSKERVKNKIIPISCTVKGRYGNASAHAWIYNGVRPVLELHMMSGTKLELTENHQVLVQDNDTLKESWVRADELKVGNRIVSKSAGVSSRLVRTAPLYLVPRNPEDAAVFGTNIVMTPTLAFQIGQSRKDTDLVPWYILEADVSSQEAFLKAITQFVPTGSIVSSNQEFLRQVICILDAHGILNFIVDNKAGLVVLGRATIEPDHYDVVQSIENNGKEVEVFDLSITGEPAFVANGLIVHNSYSTAESAVNSFTDSMLSFRQLLTYKTFYSKIFPLIAVLNNLYKDPSLANTSDATLSQVMRNLSNTNNLKLPTIQWHKSLEGKDSESQFDMLDRLSEKGFVVPLRMWASAAGLDMSALMRDLSEDAAIKARMEQLTGKRAETIGTEDKKGFDEEAFVSEDEQPASPENAGEQAPFQASLNRLISSTTRPLSIGASSRVPLLARDMTHLDLPRNGKLSKSGQAIHAQYGDHRQDKIMNDKIIKALRALRDPEHAAKVRARRAELGVTGPSILPNTSFPSP